jgi:TonB family protein
MKYALLTCTLVCCLFSTMELKAQSEPNPNPAHNRVTIMKLAAPEYPRLALQTRIAGEVKISVEIQADGRVASASFVSGHPLLARAAIDSAQQSQYACLECDDSLHSYILLYSFEFVSFGSCRETDQKQKGTQEKPRYPLVTQTQNRVTIVDQLPLNCDPVIPTRCQRVRSAKCLYLWSCACAKGYLW